MDSQKDATENLGLSRCYASVGAMLEDISPDAAQAFYREMRIRTCFRASWFIGSFVVGYSVPQCVYGIVINDVSRALFWTAMVSAGALLAYKSYRRLYA